MLFSRWSKDSIYRRRTRFTPSLVEIIQELMDEMRPDFTVGDVVYVDHIKNQMVRQMGSGVIYSPHQMQQLMRVPESDVLYYWVWRSFFLVPTTSDNTTGACFCESLSPLTPRLGGITTVLLCSRQELLFPLHFFLPLCITESPSVIPAGWNPGFWKVWFWNGIPSSISTRTPITSSLRWFITFSCVFFTIRIKKTKDKEREVSR